MKTWIKGIVTAVLTGVVILGSLPALAEPWGPPGPYRINPGFHSARMTPGEFRRLERREGHIRMAEARMNHREWARTHRMENHYDHNVYRYNHSNWRPGWH